MVPEQEQYRQLHTNVSNTDHAAQKYIRELRGDVKQALRVLNPVYPSGNPQRVSIYIQPGIYSELQQTDDIDAFFTNLADALQGQISSYDVGDPKTILNDTLGALKTKLRECLQQNIAAKKALEKEYDTLYARYLSSDKDMEDLLIRYMGWLQYQEPCRCDDLDVGPKEEPIDDLELRYIGEYCSLRLVESRSQEGLGPRSPIYNRIRRMRRNQWRHDD
jgi:hypothetical protein